MKRALLLALALIVVAGGYLGAAHLSGGAFPTPMVPVGGDRGELRRLAASFWEDIQFKDFKSAARYHSEANQGAVDIPYLIERIFMLKPELLDVMEIEVVFVDIDSTGDRGRVRTRLKCKNLAINNIFEKELMLYFRRADAQSPWTMELESSLRQIEADAAKAH
jgi:hypothetical protein